MKIKLKIDDPNEALFLLSAIEDRYKKVANSEKLWDSWALSSLFSMQKAVKKFMEKWQIKCG